MKIVSYDDYRIGVLVEKDLVDVTRVVAEIPDGLAQFRMLLFIEEWENTRSEVQRVVDSGDRVALSDVRLIAPVPSPRKVYAAPANYMAHRTEMEGNQWGGQHHATGDGGEFGMFLKSPASVSGPNDNILLPYGQQRVNHHESELVMVMGKGGSSIPRDKALDHVFGYTCGLDITVRGPEDRSKRKSFDTFSPIGPYIVTADEVDNPGNLEVNLWVNEELRQHAFTSDLIVDCPTLIANMSSVSRMEPGDLLFTGTPDGGGPITDGDLVTISISQVGEMSVSVADR